MSLLSHNLRAFVAVVRQGTVQGAAKELHLTQTGVTQRIRVLERDLGTTLFLRSRKGMKLTQEGEALLRYCQGAEHLEGEALSRITRAGLETPISLTLVGPTSIMTARVAEQCKNIYSKWPSLSLHLLIDDTSERLNRVRSGQATFAIVSPVQVPAEMESKKLKPERYVLVATSKWKGRRIGEILETERIIDFNEDDSTTLDYLKKYDLQSKIKQPRIFVNSNEAIIKFFNHGVGFGTLTHELAKSHLESGQLIQLNQGATLEDPQSLVWYPRPEMPLYFRAILDSLR